MREVVREIVRERDSEIVSLHRLSQEVFTIARCKLVSSSSFLSPAGYSILHVNYRILSDSLQLAHLDDPLPPVFSWWHIDFPRFQFIPECIFGVLIVTCLCGVGDINGPYSVRQH